MKILKKVLLWLAFGFFCISSLASLGAVFKIEGVSVNLLGVSGDTLGGAIFCLVASVASAFLTFKVIMRKPSNSSIEQK